MAEGGPQRRAFKSLLSEYLYEPYHLTYTYEDVEPQLNSKRRWKGVKTEEQRKNWYAEFLEELKEKLDKKSDVIIIITIHIQEVIVNNVLIVIVC